jgi:hypothetical protein
MADFITPTPQPIVLASNASVLIFNQPLWQATDVSPYDALDVQFGVLALTAGNLTLKLRTGMTTEIEDASWVDVPNLSVTVISSEAPSWPLVSTEAGSSKLLRFVRWRAEFTLEATGVFWIRGMARRFA